MSTEGKVCTSPRVMCDMTIWPMLDARLSPVKLLSLGKRVCAYDTFSDHPPSLYPIDDTLAVWTWVVGKLAQVLTVPGKPLSIEEVEVAPPKDGEVRIKVL